MARKRSPWRGPAIAAALGTVLAVAGAAASFALVTALTNDASWLAVEPFASAIESLGFERPEGDGGDSLGSLLLLALTAATCALGLLLMGAAAVWATIVAVRRPEVREAADRSIGVTRETTRKAGERARELRDGRSGSDR
ncbi:MAG: hypothetical protein ACR2K6_01680 [Solirubrobacterales bacterium]